MARILLVAPSRPLQTPEYTKSVMKALVAPADLATVAALTPDEFQVDIWDESVRGKINSAADLRAEYDIIGVSGYSADYERTVALGLAFKELPIPVVVGGVGVSSEPQRYRDFFDVLFVGEAEYTWPRFLDEFKAGSLRDEYRQVSRVDMADSPAPKWNSIASEIGLYAQSVVQTTRGCPFDCEFCDVISLFGRQPRHKSIEQVLREVALLQGLGSGSIMLADDNFYGDKRYYKALLRELARLNASFDYPVVFWTQITLNSSGDDEMLTLLSEANVQTVLIGVESPNIESLIETNKPQNYRVDIPAAIKKIQSRGIRVEASLVVGFDHDDETIFQQQFDFIQEACLTPVHIWTLTAMPGTRLWTRLHSEDRVFKKDRSEKMATVMVHQHNVVPKLMTLEGLLTGYRDLLVRVHAWEAFEARLEGLVSRIESFPPLMLRIRELSKWQIAKFFAGNMARGKQRRSLLKLMGDQSVRRIKQRMSERYSSDSDHDRYVRLYVETAVDEQFVKVNYFLPVLLAGIDADLASLAQTGAPELETVEFAVPESFRKPYEAIFPQLHDHVREGLNDKSRTADALVGVVHDFLTRWGSSFAGFDSEHGIRLMEICGRTIAAENGDEGGEATSTDRSFELPPLGGRRPDPKIRALSRDVIRCVEAAFRGTGDPR